MPDRPSQPAAAPTPVGRITRIAVTYTVNTDKGLRHTFHGLPRMRAHIRPDRLEELLEDLTMICEDLLAARRQEPSLNGLPPERFRVPFEPGQSAAE